MEYRIKFKPTGIVYTLPKAEIQRIITEDHGFNYEVLDKEAMVIPEPITSITTTFEQVVEEEEVRGLEDYTSEELKKFAKENGLKQSGSKAELLERCIEFTKQAAEETTEPDVVEEVIEKTVEQQVVEEEV